MASVLPSRRLDAPALAQVPLLTAGEADVDVANVYEQHFDFVWRSVRRLGVHPSQLEDAVQDVFVVVQRRLVDFEQRSSMKTWLFGIALRVAKDYRRRASKGAVEVAINDETLLGTHPDPRQAVLQTEAARLVQRALDALEEGRRAVFILTELEEFTASEVGESLGLPINTVYSRLRLARRDFEKVVRSLLARAERKQT